jgi:hypothetical protein
MNGQSFLMFVNLMSHMLLLNLEDTNKVPLSVKHAVWD